MHGLAVRSVLLRATVLAVALAPSPALAAGQTIDCQNSHSICRECCCPPGTPPERCKSQCELSPFVCCKTPPCTTINVPKSLSLADPPAPTKVNVAIGKVRMAFRARPAKGGFVDIQLKHTLVSPLPTVKVSLKGRIGGRDATVGGLLFPVAFLEAGSSATAASALARMGYDITVSEVSSETTCQSSMPVTACTALARQLGANILSLIQMSVPSGADAYRTGLENMFVAPCGTP
jgi:hypothetical protein